MPVEERNTRMAFRGRRAAMVWIDGGVSLLVGGGCRAVGARDSPARTRARRQAEHAVSVLLGGRSTLGAGVFV